MEPVSAEIWKGFIDALDKTDLEQECDLERVDGVSFVPALGPGFAKYVLRSAGTASVTAESACAALTRFAEIASAGDVSELMELIHSSSSAEHLAVQLVHIYTMQTFFYKDLNHHLRLDKAETLVVLAPLVNHMMQVPRMIPYSGTIFRGINLGQDECILYSPGLVFCWSAFSSCSKNIETAERFAGGQGTVFIVTASASVGSETLCDIEDISFYRHEKEVLMSPYTSLLVQDVGLHDSRRHVVCEVLSSSKQLTGLWDCNDDGIYYISSAGARVAWFAHARAGSRRTWAHVFFGTIAEGQLTGIFGDVCVNADRFTGELTCKVDFDSMKMKKTSRGAFGGSQWQQRKSYLEDVDRPELVHWHSAHDKGVAGMWTGTDGLTYWITVYGTSVFWFARAPSWSAAHVAMGTATGGGGKWSCELQYQDIVLSTRYRYAGRIRITLIEPDLLQVEKLNGPFGATRLVRGELAEGIPPEPEPEAEATVTAFLCNIGHPSFLDCDSAQPAGKFDVTLWGDGVDVGLIPENLQWQLKPVAGEAETFFIVSKAHNKFLDSHGNRVWLWGDGVDIGQDPDGIKWRRRAVEGEANAFYLIHVKTNKFLDSPGGSRVALWGDGIDVGQIPQNLQWRLRAV
jgi:hypothetical protein